MLMAPSALTIPGRKACKQPCFYPSPIFSIQLRFCLTSVGSPSNVAIEGRFCTESAALEDHNHDSTTAPANKGRKLPPEPLTPDEVKALIRACSKRAATGIRNRALIVVLYRAGLRISEALALFPKDLDAQASTIRVLHGKGDHDRVVGLDAGAWAILQLWLDRRAAAGINGHAPVFCTLKGRR